MALALSALIPAQADAQIVIEAPDKVDYVNSLVEDEVASLQEKIVKEWKRANKRLDDDLVDRVVDEAKPSLVVKRYALYDIDRDSVIYIRLVDNVVGYLEVEHGGSALGRAYFNEAGGLHLESVKWSVDANGSVSADRGYPDLRASLDGAEPAMVVGIGAAESVLRITDKACSAVDIHTAAVSEYTKANLPDYVVMGEKANGAGPVLITVLSSLAAIGILFAVLL